MFKCIICFLFCVFIVSCDSIVGNSTDSAIQSINRSKDSLAGITGKITASARDSLLSEKTQKYLYKTTDGITKLVKQNTIDLTDSVVVRALSITDSLTTPKQLHNLRTIREQLTGKELLYDILEIRDSLTNDETERRLNRIIDSIYKKSINIQISEQRNELRSDIERIIIIAGSIVLLILVVLFCFIVYSIRLRNSLRLITDEIDDMQNKEEQSFLKKSIKNSSKYYNVKKIIDSAIAVRIKK